MTVSSTIAAIATPVARGGVGIIRLSGPQAQPVAATIFSFSKEGITASQEGSGRKDFAETWLSHKFYHGYIHDGSRIIDEVMLVAMKAPRSYTGEDVVEIQAHSGPLVLKTVLGLLLKNGAELAGPGEFTRRAFLNGKIDLTQAEAVADIIGASSPAALNAATAQIGGQLNGQIKAVSEAIVLSLSDIEASVDFGEQAEEGVAAEKAVAQLKKGALSVIGHLMARHDTLSGIREGFRVVLAGAPNVGKSTLLNTLLGRERALVSPEPGTTRDFIEEPVSLAGATFILTDTAGLREEAESGLEQKGMELTRQMVEEAALVVFVIDAAAGLGDADLALFDLFKEKQVVIVANKTDLLSAVDFVSPEQWQGSSPVVKLSALTGEGVAELQQRLTEFLPRAESGWREAAIPNLRHRSLLEAAQVAVLAAVAALEGGLPVDLATIDLRTALEALAEITGESFRPDVLDSVFERFCVGK